MMPAALAPYETSLSCASSLCMLAEDGSAVTLEIERYLDDCDVADESVLCRCRGPVLDVGCGPGRIVAALFERGVPALGVDIAATAVLLARARGAAAIRRDVFQALPGEGQWETIVLLDGNIGIGGDVDRLLGRVRPLLAPGGHVVVETAGHADADESKHLRFACDGVVSGPSFPWAIAGASTVTIKAAQVGLHSVAEWTTGGRSFVEVAAAH